MMSLEYLAGFFDGEGCVGVYPAHQGASYHLMVQITQNSTRAADALLREISDRFGGSVGVVETRKHRQLHWSIGGDRGALFLESILPYLVLKLDQAIIASSYHRRRPPMSRDKRGRVLPMDHSDGRAVCERLKALKKSDFTVMADSADLVEPVTRLRPIAVVKG
jgi:hypothetical protein